MPNHHHDDEARNTAYDILVEQNFPTRNPTPLIAASTDRSYNTILDYTNDDASEKTNFTKAGSTLQQSEDYVTIASSGMKASGSNSDYVDVCDPTYVGIQPHLPSVTRDFAAALLLGAWTHCRTQNRIPLLIRERPDGKSFAVSVLLAEDRFEHHLIEETSPAHFTLNGKPVPETTLAALVNRITSSFDKPVHMVKPINNIKSSVIEWGQKRTPTQSSWDESQYDMGGADPHLTSPAHAGAVHMIDNRSSTFGNSMMAF